MGRFLFITGGIFVFLGAPWLVQAQTVRPLFPGPRPMPPGNPAQQAPPPVGQPGTQLPQSQPGTQSPQGQPTPAPHPEGAAGPAVPPVVTYRDGLLTVQALNSNLSSVVAAIRNKAGIEFEGAENLSERVALSLGPAPEGEVLAAIFSGSKYDFVAMGRPDSPAIVQKVILTVKNKVGGGPEGAQPQQPPANGEGDEEDASDEQVNLNNGGGDPQDTAMQPPPVQQQPPPQAQTQPKTAEQLVQEMLEMQRQKGGPENPNQVPRKIPPR